MADVGLSDYVLARSPEIFLSVIGKRCCKWPARSESGLFRALTLKTIHTVSFATYLYCGKGFDMERRKRREGGAQLL